MPSSTTSACLIVLSLAATAPPAQAARVTSPDARFSIELPKGWTIGESAVPAISRFHAPGCPPDDAPVEECEVFLVVHPLGADPGATSRDLYDKRTKALASQTKMLSEGEINVAGQSAPYSISDYKLGPKPVRHFTVLLVHQGKGWSITGWAPPKLFPKLEGTFRAMAQSVAFR